MLDDEIKAGNEAAAPAEESTGSATLDKQLSSGVLQGDTGTEVAQVWISAFLIAALGFLVYLGAFSIPLHGQDLRLFHESEALHRIVTSPGGLKILPTAPLSVVGLAAISDLSGGRVDVLHGFSLLLHLCCAVLVFLIARRLLPKGTPEVVSMLAGLLFVAHPAMAGTVNYLIAYPVLQGSFFGLLGVLLLLRGADSESFVPSALAGATLCFMLSFGSDSAMLLLPLVGLAVLRLHRPAGAGGAQFHRVALPVLVLTLVALWIVGEASELLRPEVVTTGIGARLSTFVGLCGKVLLSAVWPAHPALIPVTGGMVAGILLIVLLLAGVVVGFSRWPLFGQVAFWVLISAFSAACYASAETVFAVRYAYFPLAGLAILLPRAIQPIRLPIAFRAAGAAAAVLVLALGVCTFQRTNEWKEPVLVWQEAAARHPDSLEPWLAMGRFQWAKARTAPAEAQSRELYTAAADAWQAVLDRAPEHPDAQKHLGMVSLELGELAEALPQLMSASVVRPEDPELAMYVALAREQKARADGGRDSMIEALRAFRRAARLGQLPREALARYGVLAASFGDFATGIPALRAAVGDEENSPLASALQRFEALATQARSLNEQSDALLQQQPNSGEAIRVRSEKLLLEGRLLDAFYLLHQLIDREPSQDNVWILLGYASARLAGAENFLQEWGESRTGDLNAWRGLATRSAAGGAWEAAETYLRYGYEQSADAPIPGVTLADIALHLQQPERATAFLEAAQQAYPESPVPWLRHADMAIAAGQSARARALLDEAEKRGAAAEDLKSRRDKLGEEGNVPSGIQRTVIR